MNTKIITFLSLITPARSFSSSHIPGVRVFPPCYRCASHTLLHTADGDDTKEDGTAWIKEAMATGEKTESVFPKESEFTQSEIDEMEDLIVTLSKESNDEKRRKALSGILDKELVSPQSSIRDNSPSEENSKPVATHTELPRFAKLFQVSLDNVGERVQNEAREKALERQESSDGSTGEGKAEGEGEDLVGQLKSEEELQLWALIDMMVQSKTRVKLYMGTLGSKGAFR